MANFKRVMRKISSICALCACVTLTVIALNLVRSMQLLSRLTPAFARTDSAAIVTRQSAMGTLRKIPHGKHSPRFSLASLRYSLQSRCLAETLHVSKPTWWLESRFHFSFADYYNPSNMNFGALRVVNDDLVMPKAGFG